MKTYDYEISITGTTEKDAEAKIEALITLAVKLTTKELQKLAWIVEHDPEKTKLAKKALGV